MAIFHGTFKLLGYLVGNPVVDDIDHATDRTAAIAQCGRSPQDFDTFREQCFCGDGVIATDGRGIHGAETILQDANTVIALTANHGFANPGTKPLVGDAGFILEEFTDGRGGFIAQIFTRQNTDGLFYPGRVLLQW